MWGVYTHPHALTAAPDLVEPRLPGKRGQLRSSDRRPPRPASQSLGLGGLPTRSSSAGQKTPEQRAFARTVPRSLPRAQRGLTPELRSQAARTPRSAGHRPDHAAAAGRRGPGQEGAFQRLSPGLAPRGPCQRTALLPGGRLQCTRRVPPPGHRSAAMQPGRSAAPAAPRTEPAAAREPAAGGAAGGRRKTRIRRSWAASGRGGGRREGPSSPALRGGHPQLWGSPLGVARGSPRERLGGGREAPPPCATPDRAKSLKPGVDRISPIRPPGPASQRTGGPEGPRAAAIPARRQAADRGQGQRQSGGGSAQPSPPPHPAPHLPAVPEAFGVLLYATQSAARIGVCGKPWPFGPAQRYVVDRLGATRSPSHRNCVGLRVILGF